MSTLLTSLSQINSKHTGCIVTIGNYDGVHIGHQNILSQVKKQAKKLHAKSLAIVFEPQPKEYFLPLEQRPPRITPLSAKVKYLQAYGIDYVLCLPFDEYLQKLTATQFVQEILIDNLQVEKVIVGKDFCYGSDRQGTVAHMKEQLSICGVQVIEAQCIHYNKLKVSSTLIRKTLESADLLLAKHLLGRDFCIAGRVVRGQGIGKDWGTPTANINLPEGKLLISGVFAVLVTSINLVNNTQMLAKAPAVASVGIRPSIGDNHPCLEVHIFDRQIDLYGTELEVTFMHKLREEENFAQLEDLKLQIEQDKLEARRYLGI